MVWKAVQYMLLSVLAFTLMNVVIKTLTKDVSTYQIVFFRGLSSLALCVGYLQIKKIPFFGNHKKLLFYRGFTGTVSMALFFVALDIMPFGSAVTLRYTAPIFAAIFAILLLKEKISVLQWLCFMVAFIGVFLLKEFDSKITFIALVVILLSSLFSGLVYAILRKIGNTEHPVVVVGNFMLYATLLGGALSVFYWKPLEWQAFLLLISSGIAGFFAQFFMTKAYQIASVGTVAPMKYLESLFAIMIGWIWYEESYNTFSIVGIILIVGAMLWNVFLKVKN